MPCCSCVAGVGGRWRFSPIWSVGPSSLVAPLSSVFSPVPPCFLVLPLHSLSPLSSFLPLPSSLLGSAVDGIPRGSSLLLLPSPDLSSLLLPPSCHSSFVPRPWSLLPRLSSDPVWTPVFNGFRLEGLERFFMVLDLTGRDRGGGVVLTKKYGKKL